MVHSRLVSELETELVARHTDLVPPPLRTLQELLAPSSIQTDDQTGMEFFSQDWTRLGSKGGLSATMANITGVAKEYLEGVNLNAASVSMRMSWAADRQATRAEDIAYSLLGIFDVNVPLLYGEGKLKAFRRLQEEIMRISEDETLFAWESMEFATDSLSADVLARDPKDFVEARQLVPFASHDTVVPYAMTHRGLRIGLQIHDIYDPHKGRYGDGRKWLKPLRSPIMIWSSNDLIWGVLRCHIAHDFHNTVLIPLRRLAINVYQRDTSTNVALIPTIRLATSIPIEEIYIRNSRIPSITDSVHRRYGFLIRNLPSGFRVARVVPEDTWDPKGKVIQGDKDGKGRQSWHASIQLNIPQSKPLLGSRDALFMSLGCKPIKGAHDGPPQSWGYVDDIVHLWNEGNLDLFQRTASSENGRLFVPQFQDLYGKQYKLCLKIVIGAEKIFGQLMFVVDVKLAEIDGNLDVPELTTREKMSGLRLKGKSSLGSRHDGRTESAAGEHYN